MNTQLKALERTEREIRWHGYAVASICVLAFAGIILLLAQPPLKCEYRAETPIARVADVRADERLCAPADCQSCCMLRLGYQLECRKAAP